MRIFQIVSTTLLGAALPCASSAQVSTSLSASGGLATDQLGNRSSAMALAPRVQLDGPAGRLGVNGSVIRYGSMTWSLGGAVDGRTRIPLAGPLGVVLNGAGGSTRLDDGSSLTFTAGELGALVEARASIGAVFAGVGGSHGISAQQSSDVGFPLGPARPAERRVARSGQGAVFGVEVAVARGASIDAVLGVREDRLTVEGATAVDRVATLAVSGHRLSLALAAGARAGADEQSPVLNAALSFQLQPAVSLDLALGRYPSNPILATPGGRYASAGLSWRYARTREWTPPAAERVDPPRRGYTRLAIRMPNAVRVELAGDFNEWKPVPARRAANGVWYADLVIPPGSYRYAFRIDGSTWRIPDGATAVDDGFGGKSAWLIVPEPRSR